ncbi:MAG: hypothetical protein IT438_14570 [Phycisphaerales bacterium]|nr:hypothetical protein [Phycisphaerales bacterium]
MKVRAIMFGVASLLAAVAPTWGQTSTNSISLQAKLTGVPDGTVDLAVRFYDTETNGAQQGATITLSGVAVQGGVVSVPVSPVDPAVFNGATRYMGISVNGGPELSPRTLVTSVPYAVSSQVLAGGRVVVNATTGDVGIGTPMPNSSFGHAPTVHIEGLSPGLKLRDTEASDASGFEIFANAGSLTFVSNENGLPAFAISRDSNIGIGTTTPNSSVGHAPTLHIEGASPGIKLRDTVDPTPAGFEIYVNGGFLSIVNNRDAGVPFKISPDNVAIVQVLQITGADVAEKFDVSARSVPSSSDAGSPTGAKPLPGMVVSIDPANPGKLMVSTTAYDRKVAGVISGANGLDAGVVLGKDNPSPLIDGEHPVAMTGRVWVFADESGGRIEPGDRLTTSGSRPGYAMRATDPERWDGAVIGKAMTGMDAKTGMVLVLVNLQ